MRWGRLGAAVLAALALGLWVAPGAVARRVAVPAGRDAEAYAGCCAPVVRAMGAPLAAAAVVLGGGLGEPVRIGRAAALAAGCHVALCLPLRDWIVDDAGISFAYAENLAGGRGLVLHPAHRAEEGYSNLLWVLLLAVARLLGADVAVVAKVVGVGLGAVASAVAVGASGVRSGAAALAVGAVATGAPAVIWSSSGLESGMVCALSIAMVVGERGWLRGLAMAGLALARPEAALLIAGVVAADAWDGRRALVAAPALAALAGQQVFRMLYFGAAFPNPYYAKVSGLNPLRLLNVAGPGWSYVLGWLRGTHLLAVVPLLALVRGGGVLRRAAGLLAAQVAFAVIANGDWMTGWRFLAASHGVVAIGVAAGLGELERLAGAPRARAAALGAAGLVLLGTFDGLAEVRWAPPTPMERVAQVARTFDDLARRLGVVHPRIAWHDAGGSSYRVGLDVVDLGGLDNRDIAMHRGDREFMRTYLFEVARPTFFYSDDRAFAALWCGFHRMEEFARDYVALELPAELMAQAPICAIRREAVKEAPGVLVVRDAAGRLARVRMK